MKSTFVEDTMKVEDARDYGHIHLSEVDFWTFLCPAISNPVLICVVDLINFCQIVSHADMFENKAILLIHFSARYQLDVSWPLNPDPLQKKITFKLECQNTFVLMRNRTLNSFVKFMFISDLWEVEPKRSSFIQLLC